MSPAASGAPATPTGTVSFTDDGSPVAGCQSLRLPTVAPLQVSCTETYESTTTHTIVAAYSGDEDDAGSSASLLQAVGQVPTQTTVTSSSADPDLRPERDADGHGHPDRERSGEPHRDGHLLRLETTAIATVNVSTAAGADHGHPRHLQPHGGPPRHHCLVQRGPDLRPQHAQ